ncbi:MAG: dihydrofolate reductase family protein [Desulfurococcales archaeon]|nr:dihydrofolate reductase family protein [Desulfurococcales archaeon]
MRPKIILYTTISLDGHIDTLKGGFVLSSKCDLERLHFLRSIVDAVMVGANTVIRDNPLLTVRIKGYEGKQPYRIIVDGKLLSPVNSRVFDTKEAPTIVLTSMVVDRNKVEKLRSKGVDVIYVSDKPRFSLSKALEELSKKYPDISTILVEGGGMLISQVISEGLADEVFVSVSPWIIGGNGIEYFPRPLVRPIKLRLIEALICSCGQEVVLHYKLS